MFKIDYTPEFKLWLKSQNLKTIRQVTRRIDHIEEYNHFGDVKRIDDEIAELRWRNGLRVYFARIDGTNFPILRFLIGGNKNSQPKDITFAKNLMRHYEKEI